MSKLVSGRVKKTPQSGLTSDRYEFLGLEQAEPDLGDPLIGPSSVGQNPYTGAISDVYVLVSDDSGSGTRYWTKQTDLIAGGIVQPGSITVRDEGVVIGSINQITDINFIGSGVSVFSPASWSGAGSSSVDVQISVFDVVVPSGQTGSIAYRDSSSLLQGASSFIFNPTTQNVGIGSLIPTSKLDVLGNAKISGILTVGVLSASSGLFQNSLRVGNFEIADNTTFVRILSGSVGIGTTNPIATLDVRGTVNVSGAATFTSINVENGNFNLLTANRITTGFITATNSFAGVLTAVNANIPNLISTSITGTSATITNLVGSAVTVLNNLQVNTNTLFVNAITDRVGFGTTNPTQRVQVGPATSAVVITGTGRIGIGTTNPQYGLEARTNVGFSSFIFINGSSGNANEVLVSGGSGLPSWGAPTNITAGAANSIGVANTQTSELFYPTFTKQTQDNGYIRIDSTGLSYNPALNYLGVGTTNLNYNLTINGSVGVNTNAFVITQSTNRVGIGTTNPTTTLDVVGDIKASNSINVGVSTALTVTSGVITTTNTSQVALSSLNTSLYRSAKYNVQVTTTGQLVNNSSASVSSLRNGTNYVSGIYPNVALNTISGIGTGARADITVTAERLLRISSISNGAFAVNSTSGVVVNAPVVFDRAIPATPKENSKVTSIQVLNSGSGYTSVPTIQIAAPTNNPPIAGVTGIGTTATAVVSTLLVSNVVINTPGIHTTIPTISFDNPIGSGTSATGIVGVGLSRVEVTNPGSDYNPLPTIEVVPALGLPLGFATVSISTVFVSNVRVQNTGLGYTSGNFPVLTFSMPQVGVNSATATVNSLGISTHFTITPGIGYTSPPILTVSSPNVGVNTATLTTTLGISSITITSPGLGYTSSSRIQINASPTVTGFAASVGMGVTITGAIVSGGSNYNTQPTITFSAPNVGFNTAQAVFGNIEAGTGKLQNFQITNPGSGYFQRPTVTIQGGGGTGATVAITQMVVTDVTINNTGFGVTVVPTISIVSTDGASGAIGTARMGIGQVNVVGFGSGYNAAPSIAVTATDGITGSGASVIAGLGLTISNITLTNPGTGYSSIPSVTVTSPNAVSIAASVIAGVGISAVTVTNPGIGYSGSIPTIDIEPLNFGSGATAGVTSVFVTNVFISNPGSGYTTSDLASLPIATFSPTGTAATVGFGVSTVTLTNLGVGYTSAVAAAISFSAPNLSTGTTATGSASLGVSGILPGPGVNTTGSTQIYYIAYVSTGIVGISTGIGIGTFTSSTVGDEVFSSNLPTIGVGGSITTVTISSAGSGYTATSVLNATNFDVVNVGTGFSFTSSRVVNNYQFSDVMILQSVGSAATSCDYFEYGTIANEQILGSFNADISGNNARLLFTPVFSNNTIKVITNSITN